MFANMELSVDNLHRVKVGTHIGQSVVIFAAWCIEIALFTSDTSIGNADAWYFALCFISIPTLLYQTLTLHFVRSRRWANAYVFAALDIVWAILWLTAFASVAAWNTAGQCGSSKGCALSKTMVALGFFIFLSFVLTAAISVHGAMYYRLNGVLPGSSRLQNSSATIDPDREAFSTAPHDEYAPVGMNDKDNDHDTDLEVDNRPSHERYGNSTNSRYGQNTGYGGAAEVAAGTSSHLGGYQKPYTETETPAYSAEPNRVQFPTGNY